MRVRATVLSAFAALAMLVVAPSANAAFGLAGLSAQPANGSAGANSDFTVSLTVQDPAADLKDLTIHLPPGLVGNPLATPTCSESDLNADHCNPVSQVGTTATGALLSGTIPITVAGNVYNVAPRPGEPARFGIVLHPGPGLPPTVLQSGASLRQSDFGLDTVLNNLPNTASGLPIDITSVSLTLSGIAGDPPTGFIRNPTSCGEHVVGFDAAAYDGQTASGQTSFATDNCASEPFAPGFSATLRPMGKDGLKPEVTTVISQTIAEAGLSRAQVVLPHDLGADNAVLSHQCPAQQFQAGNCPPDSIIGSAVAASPLQSQALTGPVALVAPPTPALPQVGLDLRGPLALKLTGNFVLTPQGTGVAFEGLPDIPISRFQLTFFGGANGIVLAARQVCKPPPLNFSTDFLAHSGATTTGSTAAQIDGTCGQDAGGHGRKPKAKLELGRLGSDRPRMKLEVKAGSEKLRRVTAKLPPELRFGSQRKFKHGSSLEAGGKGLAGKAVRRTRRSLQLSAKHPVGSFSAKLAHGALLAGRRLGAHDRPRLKLRVRDARGKTIKLTVRAK